MELKSRNEKNFLVQGITKSENDNIIKEVNNLTEDINSKEIFAFIKKDLSLKSMEELALKINSIKRNIDIDVASFVNKDLSEQQIVQALVESNEEIDGEIYNQKTSDKKKKYKRNLINVKDKDFFKEIKIITEARNYTKNLQVMPPNVLNSETYAKKIEKDFAEYKNLKIKILGKGEIKKLGMGLLLSVNLGSKYEPRVAIIEYTGDASSKEKTGIIGKGVTFDAGGYNIKTRSMQNMKFDMSGSAIVAGVMIGISKLKPKANVVGVLVLTDNMINSEASTPDSVWTAMNKKTVEINNTDAEGRLAMADGLTYAVQKLNATKLIDIATLTGAVISALGNTYTGVWSTDDKRWDKFEKAAKKVNENVWRMPLHEDYAKNIKKSKVADIFNTDLSGKAGSSSAAMFLTNFIEEKEYIHLDVAGTADVNAVAKAPMVKTIIEFLK